MMDSGQNLYLNKYATPMKDQINLTKREIQILSLISNELSTREIASELFLSISTIETHRRNLLIKLKVKNVAGLIRKSFEIGYLKKEYQGGIMHSASSS